MPNYFVIRNEEIENVILWDGVSLWSPPEGTTVEEAIPGIHRGYKRVNGQWVKPEQQIQNDDPAKTSALEKLAALGLTEDEIKAVLG